MNKPRTIRKFYFKQDIDELIDELGNIPLILHKHKYILDRVHNKYPYIDAAYTAMIIKITFETIRELLIKGFIIDVRKCFTNFKLLLFQYKKGNETHTGIRTNIGTPKKLDKGKYDD